MTGAAPKANSASGWLAYLQLVRLPNVFTAAADVTMGFAIAHGGLQPIAAFTCLLLASCLLYMAGMVLNDVFDVEVDRRERPQRPLPSGRIARPTALLLGYGMLLSGVVLAAAGGWAGEGEGIWQWRSAALGLLLAVCIWLYDALLKQTPVGPVAMGSCRLLNVLLGMSAAPAVAGATGLLGFGAHAWLAGGGIGIYIMGVTLMARTEADPDQRGPLIAALAVMAAGIVLLGRLPAWLPEGITPNLRETYWLLLLVLIAFPVLRRCLIAIAQPTPLTVQLAVKHAILTLILLDAALIALAGGLQGLSIALAVALLLLPAMLLGRWVYST